MLKKAVIICVLSKVVMHLYEQDELIAVCHCIKDLSWSVLQQGPLAYECSNVHVNEVVPFVLARWLETWGGCQLLCAYAIYLYVRMCHELFSPGCRLPTSVFLWLCPATSAASWPNSLMAIWKACHPFLSLKVHVTKTERMCLNRHWMIYWKNCANFFMMVVLIGERSVQMQWQLWPAICYNGSLILTVKRHLLKSTYYM